MDRKEYDREYESQIKRRLAYYREISKLNEEKKKEEEKKKKRRNDCG